MVDESELLARFVVHSSWLRADKTVKQNAFIPHPISLDLSVTRHLDLAENEVWRYGELVVVGTPRKLHGRADIFARHAYANELKVEAEPMPDGENDNHAVISNWASEKDKQKMKAALLAASSSFVNKPV